MRAFSQLLRRFQRDERGVFLAMFAILSLALIGITGAVVDFVGVQNARSEAQFALDAAALALQPSIYTDSAESLRVKAENLVVERMGSTNITVAVESAQIVTEDGTLFLQARLDVPMSFVGLVGYDEMTVRLASQATRKKLFLEVAFVLDNSGSMSGSRMSSLKSAAKCAANILFYDACEPTGGETKNPNVRVASVPFSFFVNVGATNANESWIDQDGNSSIANDNFNAEKDDATTYAGPVDRLALYDGMVGESWAGCIEDRPGSLGTDDTVPDVGSPDTLFVPQFNPDEPDSGGFYNSYLDDTPGVCDVITGSCTCTVTTSPPTYEKGCGKKKKDWGWCPGTTTSDCTYTENDGTVSTGPSVCSCGGVSGTCDVSYTPSGLTSRQLQERMCKYDGTNPSYWSYTDGPNGGCLDAELLPLTDSISTFESEVDGMVAQGATNIHQGAIWGMRVLSPTEPFTEGRAYGTATSKVMILMTDGENTFYKSSNMNGTQYYSPYGHLWNGRIGNFGDSTSTLQGIMNDRTEASCASAKAEGIEVYSIGLDPPNTATETMLINCSSGTGYYFFPEDDSELESVYAEIANQLAALRLAQ